MKSFSLLVEIWRKEARPINGGERKYNPELEEVLKKPGNKRVMSARVIIDVEGGNEWSGRGSNMVIGVQMGLTRGNLNVWIRWVVPKKCHPFVPQRRTSGVFHPIWERYIGCPCGWRQELIVIQDRPLSKGDTQRARRRKGGDVGRW